jgi:polar amino acid transport system substrate-binding protein
VLRSTRRSALRTLLLAGLAALLAACAPRSEPTAAPDPAPAPPAGALPDLGGRRVIVAVENAYVPFNYIDPATGRAVGWDYDAVGELARRLNFTPDFREIAWDSLIQGVATGQFDLAANGITITPERARVVDFSTGYIFVRQRLLVRADETRFDDLASFAALPAARIAAQKGNTNYAVAEKLVGPARVVAYDGFGELVQALVQRDVDAVIVDDVGGQGYVGVHRDKLRLAPGALDAQELGLVFPKNSALRAPVEAALAAMRADGTLDRLNAKWFAPATP